MAAFRVVLITAPRGKKADALAKALVSERLAACVNVIPGVVSHYRWKGRMRRDGESLLIAKTSTAKFPELKRWIAANHPYATPELLSLKVAEGAKSYLDWLGEELETIPNTSNVGNAADNS
ncbi:MAG: divalent-cation tolerance protein CutA [Elusimicrobia bacterium]|nr:divalent-cation tolerance protein CutA [Elusimicrobiota bacterium]